MKRNEMQQAAVSWQSDRIIFKVLPFPCLDKSRSCTCQIVFVKFIGKSCWLHSYFIPWPASSEAGRAGHAVDKIMFVKYDFHSKVQMNGYQNVIWQNQINTSDCYTAPATVEWQFNWNFSLLVSAQNMKEQAPLANQLQLRWLLSHIAWLS